jgi:hypothetical protein
LNRDRAGTGGVAAAFAARYQRALEDHLRAPGEAGLRIAGELGRDALAADLSMLELVGLHLERRRQLIADYGVSNLRNLDDFLSAALVAFEISQQSLVEFQRDAEVQRARAEWLRALVDAYEAIAATSTLDDRLTEVCTQAKRFLGAADARLAFGGEHDIDSLDGEVIAADLRGGGTLRVSAHPGATWNAGDRDALAQFATLISAPIEDARRLQLSSWAAEVGRLLGHQADVETIVSRVQERVPHMIGAASVVVTADADEPRVSERARRPLGPALAENETAFDPGDEDGGAVAVLPLTINGRAAAMVVTYADPQPFDGSQRSFLVDLAGRVITAVERGAAYARERAIRREAESAAERLRNLERLAADLGRAATRRRVALLLLRRVVGPTTAIGGLVIAGRQRDPLVLAATGPLRRGPALADGVSMLRTIESFDVAEGEPIPIEKLPDPFRGALGDAGIGAIAAFDIAVGSNAIGSLVLCWNESARADIDSELLRAQLDIAAPNLLRAERFDVEHDIAQTLQHSMIDLPPITVMGVAWSTLYRPGSPSVACGDWYDLIPLDERRVAIAVGDIVGRGVPAAAAMGQIRSATRALTAVVHDPARLLSVLDRSTATTGPGQYSSLAYAVLDTASGMWSQSLAGHPPPALRAPDGTVSLIEAGRGALLGSAGGRDGASCVLQPGSQVVLYTDGLVERRGESLDAGLARLLDVLAGERMPPDGLCRRLVDVLAAADDDTTDDVALVAVELTGDPD